MRWLRRLWCWVGFHSAGVIWIGDSGVAWTCRHCGRESPDLRRAKRSAR
jgi:hypothetical protein